MKDLTKTPSADLIEQWKSLRDRSLFLLGDCLTQNEHAIREHNEIVPRIAAIADELDMRCSERGIALVDGFFVYKRTYFSVILEDSDHLLRESCDPTYSQDLRTWLLIKIGKA